MLILAGGTGCDVGKLVAKDELDIGEILVRGGGGNPFDLVSKSMWDCEISAPDDEGIKLESGDAGLSGEGDSEGWIKDPCPFTGRNAEPQEPRKLWSDSGEFPLNSCIF